MQASANPSTETKPPPFPSIPFISFCVSYDVRDIKRPNNSNNKNQLIDFDLPEESAPLAAALLSKVFEVIWNKASRGVPLTPTAAGPLPVGVAADDEAGEMAPVESSDFLPPVEQDLLPLLFRTAFPFM